MLKQCTHRQHHNTISRKLLMPVFTALNSGKMQLESAASRSAPLPWCRPDSLWCLSGDSDSKVSLHPAPCPLSCQGLEVSFSFPENRHNLHRNKGEYKISRGWPKQSRQGSSTGLSECDRAAAEAFHTYHPHGLVKHGHARLYLSAAPTATWGGWGEERGRCDRRNGGLTWHVNCCSLAEQREEARRDHDGWFEQMGRRRRKRLA